MISEFILFKSTCFQAYPYYEDSDESSLPKGSFLTCSADDTIRIWNLAKGIPFINPKVLKSNETTNTSFKRQMCDIRAPWLEFYRRLFEHLDLVLVLWCVTPAYLSSEVRFVSTSDDLEVR